MKKLFIISLLISLLVPAIGFSSEAECFGKVFSFKIEKESFGKVGVLSSRGYVLTRVSLSSTSVDVPEYENLIALYEGKTSEDEYKLFVFKEKEEDYYISFLQTESILGRKKVIELRCKL